MSLCKNNGVKPTCAFKSEIFFLVFSTAFSLDEIFSDNSFFLNRSSWFSFFSLSIASTKALLCSFFSGSW